MNNKQDIKYTNLFNEVEKLYKQHKTELLFHGWHHIKFVVNKSIEFAESIGANLELVKVSALVHDLNYLVKSDSEPEAGKEIRAKLLEGAGYSASEITRIEAIVIEEDIGTRDETISDEAKALSDADTLFKSLPTTPLLFTPKYISERHIDIYELANRIISEQNHLMKKGIFFYTDLAKKKYLKWAKAMLELWNCGLESFTDPDVREMLEIAKKNGIL